MKELKGSEMSPAELNKITEKISDFKENLGDSRQRIEYRAVYINARGTKYVSVPLTEATEPYDTVGLYITKNEETEHLLSMGRDDFQVILEHRFPNGLDSYLMTFHSLLKRIESIEFDWEILSRLENFVYMSYGHGIQHALAKKWATTYEKMNTGKSRKEMTQSSGDFAEEEMRKLKLIF